VGFVDGAYLHAALGQSGNVRGGAAPHGTQGYLGVDLRDVTDDQVSVLKLKETRGAEIVGVDHDGPACKSGMQTHDVVVQMNGQAIEGAEQLRRMLRETPAGRQVSFVVSRDGQQRTFSTQMANREEVEKQAWENHYVVPQPEGSSSSSIFRLHGNSFLKAPSSAASGAVKGTHSFLGTNMIVSSSYTGAKLEVMGPQLAEFFGAQGSAGLLVRHVDPNSPAADAGLKAGDVVVKVNSMQVVNGNDWSKTIHENRGKSVSIVVLRDKKEQTLTMTPDAKKRSSVDSGMDIEEFFGDSDQAEQTRATLAELAPMFDAMAASMRQRLEEVRATPEMTQMMAKLQVWSANPDFQRQMEQAQKQLRAAAEAARDRMNSPELQQQMDKLRMQMRDMMRLD
jgi:C-terminal processing protease CtpA/Prc